MGRQFQFFAFPEDLEPLDDFFVNKMDALILNWKSPTSIPLVLRGKGVVAAPIEEWPTLLCRASDIGDLFNKEVPEQGYWTVDELYSPVVEYSRCVFNGKTLTRGRMYYQTGYYDQGEWVEKDPRYVKWAEKVFRYAKKQLKLVPYSVNESECAYKVYIGERALVWHLEESGILGHENQPYVVLSGD